MHWNGGWHMGGMGMWWILFVPVLLAVGWFALSAARRLSDGAQESPERVLKRHYADGEIDSETYERKLAELRKTHDGAGSHGDSANKDSSWSDHQ